MAERRQYVFMTDDVLRTVADVWNSVGYRYQTKAVADHFGIAARTARLWIAYARTRRFIPDVDPTDGRKKVNRG